MATATLAYNDIVIIVQNIMMFLMYLFTFLLLSYVLYTRIKLLKRNDISPQFIVYLFAIVIDSFIGILDTGYIILVWWERRNNPLLFYVTTAAALAFLPLVSLSVFFLLLHRILIITRVFSKYNNIHQSVLGLSIFCMVFLLGITIAWFAWAWKQIDGYPSNTCWSVTCVAGFNGSAFSIWAKLTTGFMNSIIGIFFFFVLNRFQKDVLQHGLRNTDQANKRRANRLAFFTIITELILNFLPAFIDLILRMSINVSLTQYFGVYTLFFGAVDGTLVAIIYSKNFGTLKAVKSSIVRLT